MRNPRERSAKKYGIDFSTFKDEDHPVLDSSRDSHLPVAHPISDQDFNDRESGIKKRLNKIIDESK